MPPIAAHLWTSTAAAFLASLVECVEALTVVLAVGATRGWRAALLGVAAAVAILAAIILVLGRALTRVPLHLLQLVVGTMLLLFGLRWLRKAILRSAGLIPLHDEAAAFAKNSAKLSSASQNQGFDRLAFATAFNITMLEGTEVVFIVIAVAAGGTGLMLPASLGAVAALLVVTALGLALHRPLARVPENTLKFLVGILLSAFGTFWIGEGMALACPSPTGRCSASSPPTGSPPQPQSPLQEPLAREVRMNALKTIAHEILGLFVDDGTLTIATLLWLAVVWLLIRPLQLPIPAGILLFLGLAAILVESVTRFARKSSR